jgi:hypothetical protein
LGGRHDRPVDWTGVTPTGAFTLSKPIRLGAFEAYTTSEVTLTAVPGFLLGDYNSTVEAADYFVGA